LKTGESDQNSRQRAISNQRVEWDRGPLKGKYIGQGWDENTGTKRPSEKIPVGS